MKISYLIFSHDETDTLQSLLDRISQYKDNNDEIIVADDFSTNIETQEIIKPYKVVQYKLEDGYANKKNKALQHCYGDYIFAIDADEIPTELLLVNIKDIISSNQNIESFWIPRINLFKGVTKEHASKWGWRLTTSKIFNKPIVNAYDPQCRLFMNKSEIHWEGRLHERIVGNSNYVFIPDNDETLALIHIKTIEKQVETNLRYNKDFTMKENQGFNLPK